MQSPKRFYTTKMNIKVHFYFAASTQQHRKQKNKKNYCDFLYGWGIFHHAFSIFPYMQLRNVHTHNPHTYYGVSSSII